jgi:outer membrane protein assembly factor BamB/tetratricopeptide (TPR) repeat protein
MSRPVRAAAVVLTVLFVTAPSQAADAPIEIIGPTLDPAITKRLEAVRDRVKDENWPLVVHPLQKILNADKDVLVKGKDGKPVLARVEANRLIRGLPAKGMAIYRLAYSGIAKELLKEAKDKSDLKLFEVVARRFANLGTGLEALELLASYHFDVGHPPLGAMLEGLPPPPGPDRPDLDHLFRAARAFHRLLEASGGSKGWSAATLCKAAAAFHSVGDRAKSDLLWKQLSAEVGKDGVKAGARRVALAELRGLIDDLPVWPMSGGGLNRTGRGTGSAPLLKERWTQSAIGPEPPWAAIRAVEKAVRTLEGRREAVLPAFYPIAGMADVGFKNKVRTMLAIYRSYVGIHAVDIKSGKLVWEVESDWSLERMHRETPKVKAMQDWLNRHEKAGHASVVFENSVLGMLSSDSLRVYAVEDIAVPPVIVDNLDGDLPWGQKVDDAIHHNRLLGFNLGDGKLVWELGGCGKGQLDDSAFLGPPLPLGGKLYVLNEKGQELRLVCLEPKRGKLGWLLPVAKVRHALLDDPYRRAAAAPLAYGEGVLVCPTNAGAVVGVDIESASVLWGHVYRDRGDARGQVHWKAAVPVVADGNVVFTAPDAAAIHCLGLRDGALRWKADPRDGDLYLAGVYGDKVVIVGKDRCRALGLKDGKQTWSVDSGLPSGRGIADGDLYYLPLKAAAKTKEPEVCVISIAKGEIVGHARSRTKEVPGNLLFADGMVISQTAQAIVAYPQLNAKLKEIDDRLRKDPKDPIGLTDRAELRLNKRDLQGAIDDLHAALASKPSNEPLVKARAMLYAALTELLRSDFDAGEKYLEEYKKLIKFDVQEESSVHDRRLNYLMLIARVHEKRGKVVEALNAYLEVADKADPNELLSTLDDPASRARPTAWARGRIEALIAKATPEQRKLLEAEIDKRWQVIRKSKDPQAMRRFLEIYGSRSSQGRNARFELAELLLAKGGAGSFLETEQHLLILRRQTEDRKLAGRAVEALARLMVSKGLLEDAVHYYKLLGRELAKLVIRDGKTGADFLDATATDKRFLPYLAEQPNPLWRGKIRAVAENGNFTGPPLFFFEHEGERLPFFQRNLVALNTNFHQFWLIDRKSYEVRWRENLTRTNFEKYLHTDTADTANYTPRYQYHAVGHVVVLPLGHRVFGIDPITHRVLWEKSLFGAGPIQEPAGTSIDPEDGQAVNTYKDGFQIKLGRLSLVEPSHICLLTRDGLVALDPISGRTLWTRSADWTCEIFGDADLVYLVEVSKKGQASGARAVRACDGVSAKVPDFAAAYERRVRIVSGRILSADRDPKESIALQLYDVQRGKDVWKRTCKAGAIVLRSQAPELTGVVEPDGAVSILDLAGKDVAKTKINPKHIHNADAVHLLQDRMNYYVAIDGPNHVDHPASAFEPTSGLRAVPVNGWVYAINRQSGKLSWTNEYSSAVIVLNNFQQIPVLVCTSRYRLAAYMTSVRITDKLTGKLLYDQAELKDTGLFFALNADLAAGKIELIGKHLKITCSSAEAPSKR